MKPAWNDLLNWTCLGGIVLAAVLAIASLVQALTPPDCASRADVRMRGDVARQWCAEHAVPRPSET